MVASELEMPLRSIWRKHTQVSPIYYDEDGFVRDVLSALSDRSRSEVGGDVVEAAAKTVYAEMSYAAVLHDGGETLPEWNEAEDDVKAMCRRIAASASGIIAADAERRVKDRLRALAEKDGLLTVEDIDAA